MGLSYRDPDYANNFILPYPDLLLLSDSSGKMIDASANIDDQNNGEGKECGFSHDASSGDFDNDGDLDIFHSTRDFASDLHGAHIAINDGNGSFNSMVEGVFPQKPKANEYDNNQYLFKGLPINLDNEGCLDLISSSDSWMNESATKNYLFSLINIRCD